MVRKCQSVVFSTYTFRRAKIKSHLQYALGPYHFCGHKKGLPNYLERERVKSMTFRPENNMSNSLNGKYFHYRLLKLLQLTGYEPSMKLNSILSRPWKLSIKALFFANWPINRLVFKWKTVFSSSRSLIIIINHDGI